MILGFGLFVAVVLIVGAVWWYIRKHNTNSADEYSTASTAIYNIVAAVSIVVAGVWAISTFDLLKQRDIAQVQLKELKSKLKNIESSKIEVNTEVVDYQGAEPDKKNKGLIIKVKLTNVGNTPIEFDLSKSPLKIYEVEAQGVEMGYNTVYEPVIFSELASMDDKEGSTPLTKFVSLMSSERTLSYFAVLPKNKMYYIVFKTEAGDLAQQDDELNDGEEKGVPQCDSDAQCKWFVSKYLYLK